MRFRPSSEVRFLSKEKLIESNIQIILPENEELLTNKGRDLEIETEDENGPQQRRNTWRKLLSFFNKKTLYRAKTVGWWEDLNELSDNIGNSENDIIT